MEKSIVASIKIRDFPFPFKAALAICSDIDNCDLNNFIRIHRFLNSKKYGIGLPVADSFFGFANNSHQLSYLNLDGSVRCKEAEFIRQAIKDGIIDSLHSWGDFNDAPPNFKLLQNIANKLTNEFVHYGLNIPIWINHGSPNNHQNLFSRLCSKYHGDDPKSPLYTMPLIKQLGIKYYWGSELVDWPLSSSNLKFFKKNKIIILNTSKNFIKMLLNKSQYTRSKKQVTLLMNRVTLRDKNILFGFNRFARHPNKSERWMADRNSLRYSLDKMILEELINDEGYLIIYTHFAKPKIEKTIFEKKDEESLLLLFEYYQKKIIWVATTSTLLQFKTVRDYIQWEVTIDKKNDIIINITGINCPVSGRYIPTEKDISGIYFYTPFLDKTSIKLAGRDVHVKKNPSGNIGKLDGWLGFDIAGVPKTQLIE
jgi:hypothetical protein